MSAQRGDCPLAFSLVGVIAAIFFLSRSPTASRALGTSVPASVTNDAELLVYQCGKPDLDDSTENDRPRPLIPTRFIEYRAAGLRFGYVPGGDAKAGDPPPYRWTLAGVVDIAQNTAISAAELNSTLSSRLPRSDDGPKFIEDAGFHVLLSSHGGTAWR